MSCVPTEAPAFLPFPERSQLSHEHHLAPIGATSEEPKLKSSSALMGRLRLKVSEYQDAMDAMTSRRDRIRFIRGMASPPLLDHAPTDHDMMIPTELKLKEYDASFIALHHAMRPEFPEYEVPPDAPDAVEQADSLMQQPSSQSTRRRRVPAATVEPPSPSTSPVPGPSEGPPGEDHGARGGTAPADGGGVWPRAPSFLQRLWNVVVSPFQSRSSRITPVISDVVVGDKRSRDEAAHNVYSAELSALSLDPSAPPETQYPQEATASHGARSRPGPQRPARDAVPTGSHGKPRRAKQAWTPAPRPRRSTHRKPQQATAPEAGLDPSAPPETQYPLQALAPLPTQPPRSWGPRRRVYQQGTEDPTGSGRQSPTHRYASQEGIKRRSRAARDDDATPLTVASEAYAMKDRTNNQFDSI